MPQKRSETTEKNYIKKVFWSDTYFYKNTKEKWGYSHVAELFCSICETLNLIPRATYTVKQYKGSLNICETS
jgi:hypothetical protein